VGRGKRIVRQAEGITRGEHRNRVFAVLGIIILTLMALTAVLIVTLQVMAGHH
jgi:hypothetical protein